MQNHEVLKINSVDEIERMDSDASYVKGVHSGSR